MSLSSTNQKIGVGMTLRDCAANGEDCPNKVLDPDSQFCANHIKCFTYKDDGSRCDNDRIKTEKGWSLFCAPHALYQLYLDVLYDEKSALNCRSKTLYCDARFKKSTCYANHSTLKQCAQIFNAIYDMIFHPQVQGNNHQQYKEEYNQKLKMCKKLCPIDDNTMKKLEAEDAKRRRRTSRIKERQRTKTVEPPRKSKRK